MTSTSSILHVFNPGHDLALAAGTSRYTPPAAAVALHRDLGFLPALWAGATDFVWVSDVQAGAEAMARLGVPLRCRLVDRRDLQALLRREPTAVHGVAPWGWDAALRSEMQRLGVPMAILPDDAALEAIRHFSHRAWAARELLLPLRDEKGTLGEAVEHTAADCAMQSIRQLGSAVVKAPWSSSGRGVFRAVAHDMAADAALRMTVVNRLAGIIRRQGSVMIEPYYNKVLDFAMEFERDAAGTVHGLGLSVFDVRHGAYIGNRLDSEIGKTKLLARYIDEALLQRVQRHITVLTARAFAGTWVGPFGVDMMIVQTPDGYRLHPCVELNLRRTMGHTALSLGHLLPQSALPAVMRILCDGCYHLEITSAQ